MAVSLDRRQQKTRRAIFEAMRHLLEEKSYTKISVQDIIDTANIGRSTFYAHFDTKDDVIQRMCESIFAHVNDEDIHVEATHNFSEGNCDVVDVIAHLLYHLREERLDVTRLVQRESKDLFLGYVEGHLQQMFSNYVEQSEYRALAIPRSFVIHQLVHGCSAAIVWWIEEGMKREPKEVARYYGDLMRLRDFT